MAKTTTQVKQEFEANGIPISQWADQNGFRRCDVYRVLNGFSACKRGIPFQIAIKLGIKDRPSIKITTK